MDFIIFIVSMAALIYGADFIIQESEKIARRFKIPHFIIGATLVAFGTSLPEMAASVTASYSNKSDMAVANVIGSVVFNITLILGVVFFISKETISKRELFSLDSAWVIIPVIIFLIMSQDGKIDRFDGVLLLLLMLSYLIFLFVNSKEDIQIDTSDNISEEKFIWKGSLIFLFVGFILTIGGANFVVQSGADIARIFGVSEWVIGIFLISLGTSLPELVVSVAAIKKGNAEMSIGNVIGSNVANFSMVLGSAAIAAPLLVDIEAVKFDMSIMAGASLSLVFILANKLYNKTGSIFLFILLILFIKNSF